MYVILANFKISLGGTRGLFLTWTEKLSISSDTNEQHVVDAKFLFFAILLEHNLAASASDYAALKFRGSQIAKKYACMMNKTVAAMKEIASHSVTDILILMKSNQFVITYHGNKNAETKIYPFVLTSLNFVLSQVKHLCMLSYFN